jgi:mono/diheme cytochrome c family protein
VKRVAKWGLALFGIVALAAGGGALFLRFGRPRLRPATSETVARTPARLERGTYLVEHLLPCVGCHSQHDLDHFGTPVVPGGLLAGGLTIDRSYGLPGVVQPPNITPDRANGIGDWSDGEVMRAIREGIHKDGRALFPMMPYGAFAAMGDEDLRAVVVYLRNQPPIANATAPIEVDFPVSLFIRAAPAPVEEPVAVPSPSDHLAYGAYLVRMAYCVGCHTPMKGGRPDGSMEFAGGREFPVHTPEGTFRVVTANITPDPDAYFGVASREEWIGRVRSFASFREQPPRVARGLITLMPWIEYSGLSDEDLGAIYDFMKTVKPIHHEVVSFPDFEAPAPSLAAVER